MSRDYLVLIMLFSLAGCLPPGSKGDQSSQSKTEPPSLVGYWQAACAYFPGQGGEYKRYDVEFGDDSSQTILEIGYANEDCVDGQTLGETVSSFTFGEHLGDGMWEINLRSAVIDYESYQIIERFGDRLYFGEIKGDLDTTSSTKRPQVINRERFHTLLTR